MITKKANGLILFYPPQRLADWDDRMLENARNGLQDFKGKSHAIRLADSIFKYRGDKADSDMQILKNIVRDYPELGDEIRERFPEIFS